MKQCPTCGRSGIGPGTTTLSHRLGDSTFTAEVPAEVCPHCGESLVHSKDLRWFETAVARAAMEAGLHNGEALRWMRKSAGLRAVDVAALLGVTPETLSRWENDKRTIERASWAALAALATEGLDGPTAARLRAAAAPAPSPAVVRLGTAA